MATTPAATAPEAMAVAFARVLRGAGVAVPVSAVVSFSEALGVVGLERRDDVYWAGRATLVRRPEDHALYDRAFRAFWEHAVGAPDDDEPDPVTITLAVDSDEDDGGDEPDAAPPGDDPAVELRFSITEVLRHKDFAP